MKNYITSVTVRYCLYDIVCTILLSISGKALIECFDSVARVDTVGR